MCRFDDGRAWAIEIAPSEPNSLPEIDEVIVTRPSRLDLPKREYGLTSSAILWQSLKPILVQVRYLNSQFKQGSLLGKGTLHEPDSDSECICEDGSVSMISTAPSIPNPLSATS